MKNRVMYSDLDVDAGGGVNNIIEKHTHSLSLFTFFNSFALSNNRRLELVLKETVPIFSLIYLFTLDSWA
jgi:hypothetical protein